MASACPMPSALSGIKMATWKALTGAGLALSGRKFKHMQTGYHPAVCAEPDSTHSALYGARA